MNVLVTGGTGHLGRDVVAELRKNGHRPRVLSRRPGPEGDLVQADLATGEGIESAVAGVDAVIHAASDPSSAKGMRATDVDGTRRLLEAASRAHVAHFLYVSIVGIDGMAVRYYREKLAAEQIVRENIVPWSILRATQFHTLIDFWISRYARMPFVATIPAGWQFQPVDTRDVGARLVAALIQAPAGMLPDFGGPEVRRFRSLAISWLEARRMRKRVVSIPVPIGASRQIAQGQLLCPAHMDGTTTFEQYLARKYGAW
ncbi:MAG TPA: NAD(P)H-binding protein [Candidatus Dormibacteraeota bacterium]|nr:NAD(P)H-binding protein [Candidatus Dormibacteraeota bacterium]